jgi:KilA-N domain
MQTEYETIAVDHTALTVDVSLLSKTEEMFFNATDMAKPFRKKVKHFLALESTKEYMGAIFKGRDSTLLKNRMT